MVHFSDHEGYYSAYKYIRKFDEDVFHSHNHPNLQEIGSPRTSSCQQAYRRKRSQSSGNSCTSETNKHSENNRSVAKIKNFQILMYPSLLRSMKLKIKHLFLRWQTNRMSKAKKIWRSISYLARQGLSMSYCSRPGK